MIIETKGEDLFGVKSVMLEKVEPGEDSPNDIIMLVSTQAPDSDGDIVFQRKTKEGDGWKLDHFNGAPVITWQHSMWDMNISGVRTHAKVMKHATKGWGLHLVPLTFDQEDEGAVVLESKVRRDIIKEASVGFQVKQWQPRIVDGRRVGMNIYESYLIETAIANRGANFETEVVSKNMMLRAGGNLQTGGNKTAIEAVEEMEHLKEQVALLLKEVNALGDRFDKQENEETEKVQTVLKETEAQKRVMAGEVLALLKGVGSVK